MSNTHMTNFEVPDTSNWNTYAYICDGEVAHIMKIDPNNDYMNAVLSSKPIVIQAKPGEEVGMGYTYEDGKFYPPENS